MLSNGLIYPPVQFDLRLADHLMQTLNQGRRWLLESRRRYDLSRGSADSGKSEKARGAFQAMRLLHDLAERIRYTQLRGACFSLSQGLMDKTGELRFR